MHASEDPAEVSRAADLILDGDLDPFRVQDGWILDVNRQQLAVAERCDLARQPHHREEVDAVHCRRHVEHLVPDREHVDEGCPGLGAVLEHDDPAVVVAELELALRQDHPPGLLAAKLALGQGSLDPGKQGTRKPNGNRRAGAEVPGAADDLARLAFTDVDLAELELVRVRMLPRLEHRAHAEVPQVAVDVGNADLDQAFDIEGRHGQPVCDLVGGRVHPDVLTQPREGSTHQNWVSSRRSSRQSSRKSGMPWRSTAMRSSPQPKANPEYRSGS